MVPFTLYFMILYDGIMRFSSFYPNGNQVLRCKIASSQFKSIYMLDAVHLHGKDVQLELPGPFYGYDRVSILFGLRRKNGIKVMVRPLQNGKKEYFELDTPIKTSWVQNKGQAYDLSCSATLTAVYDPLSIHLFCISQLNGVVEYKAPIVNSTVSTLQFNNHFIDLSLIYKNKYNYVTSTFHNKTYDLYAYQYWNYGYITDKLVIPYDEVGNKLSCQQYKSNDMENSVYTLNMTCSIDNLVNNTTIHLVYGVEQVINYENEKIVFSIQFLASGVVLSVFKRYFDVYMAVHYKLTNTSAQLSLVKEINDTVTTNNDSHMLNCRQVNDFI